MTEGQSSTEMSIGDCLWVLLAAYNLLPWLQLGNLFEAFKKGQILIVDSYMGQHNGKEMTSHLLNDTHKTSSNFNSIQQKNFIKLRRAEKEEPSLLPWDLFSGSLWKLELICKGIDSHSSMNGLSGILKETQSEILCQSISVKLSKDLSLMWSTQGVRVTSEIIYVLYSLPHYILEFWSCVKQLNFAQYWVSI